MSDWVLEWLYLERNEPLTTDQMWSELEWMSTGGCEMEGLPASKGALVKVLTELMIAKRVKQESGKWIWLPPEVEPVVSQGRLF